MAKSKKPSFVTPHGRFVFPNLNTPDTKFDKAGVYKVDLNPDDEAAGAKLLAKLEEWREAAATGVREDRDAGVVGLDDRQFKAWEKATEKLDDGETVPLMDLPVKEQDEEYGGGLLFSFKMKAEGTTRNGEKYERKPRLFDAAGTPIDELIRTGTEGYVSFEPYLYYSAGFGGAGVALRLKAVQVTKLAQGAANAEDFGFEAVDGFSIDEDAGDFDSEDAGDGGYDFGG